MQTTPTQTIQAIVHAIVQENREAFQDIDRNELAQAVMESFDLGLKDTDDKTLQENEVEAMFSKAFESLHLGGGVDIHSAVTAISAFANTDGFSTVSNQLVIGQSYFAFTATFGYLGTLVSYNELGYYLANVVWVGHAGDVDKMVAKGSLSAAAPLKSSGFFTWHNTIALTTWNHDLPTKSVTD